MHAHAGQTTIAAELSFTAVQTGQPVTVAQRTLLTAKIPTPLALTAPNTNLPVGDTVTVTVSTTDAPPFGGLTVFITGAGTGNGTFPPSVTIPEYQTSEIFQFTATEAGPYTLSATVTLP